MIFLAQDIQCIHINLLHCHQRVIKIITDYLWLWIEHKRTADIITHLRRKSSITFWCCAARGHALAIWLRLALLSWLRPDPLGGQMRSAPAQHLPKTITIHIKLQLDIPWQINGFAEFVEGSYDIQILIRLNEKTITITAFEIMHGALARTQ